MVESYLNTSQSLDLSYSLDNCSSLSSPQLFIPLLASVAVSAEILLRSPQKSIIFIIKKIVCWVKVSKNKIINILKKTSLLLALAANFRQRTCAKGTAATAAADSMILLNRWIFLHQCRHWSCLNCYPCGEAPVL